MLFFKIIPLENFIEKNWYNQITRHNFYYLNKFHIIFRQKTVNAVIYATGRNALKDYTTENFNDVNNIDNNINNNDIIIKDI